MAEQVLEQKPEQITVTQDSPEAADLSLSQFKEVRRGKSVEVPKIAEPQKESDDAAKQVDGKQEPKTEVEQAETGEGAKVEEVQAKPRKDPKKRIEKLTREVYEKDDEIERLRRENDDLKKKVPVEKVAAKVEEDPEPDEEGLNPKTGEKWKDWKEFSRAHTAWAFRQEQKASRTQTEQERQMTQARENMAAHQERTNKARGDHDDFDEVCQVIGEADMPEAVSQTLAVAFVESEDGPELMYHIGQHPELLKEFAKLTPIQAIRKLDRLAASLNGEKKTEKEPEKKTEKTESKASDKYAPITPIGSGAGKTVNFTEDMSLADFKKARKEGRI